MTAAALQAELDEIVEGGLFSGVTAAVIVADRGHWAGAAGTSDGARLTPDSRLPTHSAGKTIVAAQILRLVEDGKLRLADPAAEYLPPKLGFFDANGATIGQVLAMRSGIPGLREFTPKGGFYPAERASTAVEVFRKLPEPQTRPGGEPEYASTNYILLGTIIEHVTGRPLAEVLRSDVLDHPGLDGLVHTVEDALAADGWGVESTPGSLARWGYELYGGSVLSDDSLRKMTDFHGDWYGLGVMNLSSEYNTPRRRPRRIEFRRYVLLPDPPRGAAKGRCCHLGPGQHGSDGRPVRHLQQPGGRPDAGPEGQGATMIPDPGQTQNVGRGTNMLRRCLV